MKASEIREHFVSQADWGDPEKTVDRVIIGDPEKDVATVLVTWISSLDAVRAAANGGFDMLITHEPTFWRHRDEHLDMDKTEIGRTKRRLIEDAGLVVLRIHDVWDRMPEIGIPWAWARFLGLGETPAVIGRDGYQHRYDIEPVTVDEFARRVAARTAEIGEPYVQVTGDAEQRVSRIGIGTGCGCDQEAFREMGCDLSIVCDDGSCYWRDIQHSADMGHPVIRVNHGTSEEPGMVTLAQYVNDRLSGVRATHRPHGSTFRLVGVG